MPIDDDRQLAEEVEAALKALGIARLRSRSTGPVERHVKELGGAGADRNRADGRLDTLLRNGPAPAPSAESDPV